MRCEPCGFLEVGLTNVEWHRQHMAHHLATFPDVDDVTRHNLAWFIERAEWLETEEAR